MTTICKGCGLTTSLLIQDSIIGTQDGRHRILTDKGKEVMFSVPTLADYVTLTPRMVTPVSGLRDGVCTWSKCPSVDLSSGRFTDRGPAGYPCTFSKYCQQR